MPRFIPRPHFHMIRTSLLRPWLVVCGALAVSPLSIGQDFEVDPIDSRAAIATERVPEGLSGPDWSRIRAAYEAGQHAPLALEDGGYEARSPGQQWRTRFDGRAASAQADGLGTTLTTGAGFWFHPTPANGRGVWN